MATSKDLGRVRLVWQGEYDEETQYTYLDAVSYEGSSYMCFTETPPPVGALPTDEDYFLVLAEKGSPSDATENSYLWRKESGSVVQCYPVPESALDLKVYFEPVETLPEEGDKSPDNPSTITGTSSVELVRCGKNLMLGMSEGWEQGGIDGGGNYYSTESRIRTKDYYVLKPSTPYVINVNSEDNTVDISIHQYQRDLTHVSDTFWKTSPYYFTTNTKTVYGASPLKESNNAVLDFDEVQDDITVQLELGSTATAYEPYVGDTYTIELPDTFYGGYIDFERGVLVQEWAKFECTGNEVWYDNGVGYFHNLGYATEALYYKNCCTHFINLKPTYGGFFAGQNYVLFNYKDSEGSVVITIDEFKNYLRAEAQAYTPVTTVCKLATPIEHQLSDLPPIKALAQSDRYTPQINTIFSNANGNVEVGYAKSPIQEHLDLANAITATGGANV